ncbi:NUDIX domain-containing protein [Aeromicrobium sp. NPDC092404]|uniref:(deoxy)nucleoside triphosphate pyrophosphohydrolase n=1 Tax=Aeromicrobium sp. NPDC092404 TaxID=3154976 RepID=UPI0034134C17
MVSSLPLVVGAVIVDAYPNVTRVLAARRTRPPELAGHWEFPGGKVEPGESAQQALIREIAEELSVDIEVLDELLPPTGTTWPASNGYRMRIFYAILARGDLRLGDGHDLIRWLPRHELLSVGWLASDRDVTARLLSHIRSEVEAN